MAGAAEEGRIAEGYKKVAMYMRECVKSPDIYDESKELQLRPAVTLCSCCVSNLTTMSRCVLLLSRLEIEPKSLNLLPHMSFSLPNPPSC